MLNNLEYKNLHEDKFHSLYGNFQHKCCKIHLDNISNNEELKENNHLQSLQFILH